MAKTPNMHCVIARYQEDVAWLERLDLPAVVYDKSGAPGPNALPNMGRETHTYLHHIVTYYPEFPEYILFLQADPFPHLPAGMTPEQLRQTVLALAERGVPFKGLAYYSLKCDGLGRPHDMRAPHNKGKWPGWDKDIPVGEVYAELFRGPVPESFHAKGAAGLFLVRKDRILLRPMGLYHRALELIMADPDDANNTGHAFERLWSLIFNGYAALNKENYE